MPIRHTTFNFVFATGDPIVLNALETLMHQTECNLEPRNPVGKVQDSRFMY